MKGSTWPAFLHSQEGEAGCRAQAGNALHQLTSGCDTQHLPIDQVVRGKAGQVGQCKGDGPGQATQEGRLGHIQTPFLHSTRALQCLMHALLLLLLMLLLLLLLLCSCSAVVTAAAAFALLLLSLLLSLLRLLLLLLLSLLLLLLLLKLLLLLLLLLWLLLLLLLLALRGVLMCCT